MGRLWCMKEVVVVVMFVVGPHFTDQCSQPYQ